MNEFPGGLIALADSPVVSIRDGPPVRVEAVTALASSEKPLEHLEISKPFFYVVFSKGPIWAQYLSNLHKFFKQKLENWISSP